jgi:hypothetical protein
MAEEEVSRLAVIKALPHEMQDHALVDWPTVASLLSCKDVEHTRETLIAAGVPLVHVTGRKRLPRWGALREFRRARERAA